MKVIIAVPFRGDDNGWRTKAFFNVRQQINRLAQREGYQVAIGDSGDDPFSIARTWNSLLEKADWEIAIRWAADWLIESLDSIVHAVNTTQYYTLPFDKSTKLTRDETRELYAGKSLPLRDDPVAYGGISVITREAWDTVGGYDHRFVGYGAEDYAFVHGIKVNFGPRERISGRTIGLWHVADRSRRAQSSKDPYFQKRQENLNLFNSEVAPISTKEEWATYLRHRYEGIN